MLVRIIGVCTLWPDCYSSLPLPIKVVKLDIWTIYVLVFQSLWRHLRWVVIPLKLVKSFVLPFLNHFYFLIELNQPNLNIVMTCLSYPFFWFHLSHFIIFFSHKVLGILNNLLFSMFSTCFLTYFAKELFIKNHFCDLYHITTHPNSKYFKIGRASCRERV